jgi:hypothetical protein
LYLIGTLNITCMCVCVPQDAETVHTPGLRDSAAEAEAVGGDQGISSQVGHLALDIHTCELSGSLAGFWVFGSLDFGAPRWIKKTNFLQLAGF